MSNLGNNEIDCAIAMERLDVSISLTLTKIKAENGIFSRNFVR